jgi:hypothetical protein
MTTTKTIHRSLVSLNLSTVIAVLISIAKAIVQALSGNVSFPNPTPTLAEVTTAITALETAEALAISRIKGAVAARNDKRRTLVALMQELKAYVQKVADANQENGAALIQSAGMNVKKAAVRKPRIFAITQGAVSGAVKVVVPAAGRRAAYDWEWSTDGGKTWQLAPSTMQAKTSLVGLAAGTTVTVRYRAVTKAGEADWSQPTSFLVK